MIKVIRNMENVFCGIACVVFLLLMLIGASDVIGRYVFNHPIKGTLEFSQIMIAVIVFMSWGYVQRERGHVRLDFVINRFSPRARQITDITTSFVSLCIFGLIVWHYTF